MDLRGRVAVVTGAGSGIGRAIATGLGHQGSRLALVDIDEAALSETQARIGRGGDVSAHVADVSSRADMAALPRAVLERHSQVDVLVSNAGLWVAGPLLAVPLEDFELAMNVNFWGAVYAARFFLPHLQARDQAHIVNVSSAIGLLALPEQTAYSASKFAIRGFTDALRAELAGTRVGVTAVYPSAVDTHFITAVRAAGVPREEAVRRARVRARTSVDRVAARVIRAIRRNKSRARVGSDAHALDWLTRISPSAAYSLAARLRLS